MLQRILLLVCGFAVHLAYSPSAYSSLDVVHRFKSGQWEGFAYANNETGEFSHCALVGTYASGTNLIFLMIGTDFYLGLQNKNWKLDLVQKFEAGVKIDRTNYGQLEFEAVQNDIARTYMGSYESVSGLFRRGRLLTIVAAKSDFYFRLDGTFNALPRLRDCAAFGSMFAQQKVNPFADRSDTNENPFSSRSERSNSEQGQWVLTLLEVAGFANVSKFKSDGVDAPIQWRGDGVSGFLSVVGREGKDERAILRDTASAFDELCKGRQASAINEPENLENWIVLEYVSSCESQDRKLTVHIIGVREISEDTMIIIVNFLANPFEGLEKSKKFSKYIIQILSEGK